MKRATHSAFTRGFTLMEILIVIALIGILIAMVTGSFVSSQVKSRDARRKSDLHQIMIALETYFNDKGQYPNSSSGDIMGCGAGDSQLCPWNGKFSDSTGTIYMVTLPTDPKSGRRYYYKVGIVSGVRTKYWLYARLENAEDGAVVQYSGNPGAYTGVVCVAACTTNCKCNYGISSTDTTPADNAAPGPDD